MPRTWRPHVYRHNSREHKLPLRFENMTLITQLLIVCSLKGAVKYKSMLFGLNYLFKDVN